QAHHPPQPIAIPGEEGDQRLRIATLDALEQVVEVAGVGGHGRPPLLISASRCHLITAPTNSPDHAGIRWDDPRGNRAFLIIRTGCDEGRRSTLTSRES